MGHLSRGLRRLLLPLPVNPFTNAELSLYGKSLIILDGEGTMKFCLLLAVLPSAGLLAAQTLHPVQDFVTAQPERLSIQQTVVAQRPFTVTGPRGALLGQQDGSLEAWIFPWKILSGLRLRRR